MTPTGYALLGLLSFGRELTGYELKQWADDSLRFFYAAPAMSQVYAELGKLKGAGLVHGREVGDGGRTIRIFSLTPEGRATLSRWLDSPVPPPQLKHHLALRVFLGHLADRRRLLEQIAEQRAWAAAMLADLVAVREGLDDGELWHHARRVADWGLDYYRAGMESLDRLAAQLAEADGPEPAAEEDDVLRRRSARPRR